MSRLRRTGLPCSVILSGHPIALDSRLFQGNFVPRKTPSAPVGGVVIGAANHCPVGLLECFATAHRWGIASFAPSVRAGTLPQPSVDKAPSSLCVADAIQRALRSGKPVAVPA